MLEGIFQWPRRKWKKKVLLSSEQIQKAADIYHTWQSEGTDGANYAVPELYRSVRKDEIEKQGWSLVPSKYIEFVDHDLEIDYAAEMSRIQKEMREVLVQEIKSQKMLEDAFRGIGYELGLTFEEKAFYDILMALRDEYDFEYGKDKIVDGVSVNEKCRSLARKIKEIIDAKSSFADWLNNQNVRDQLKFDIKVCLIKNGYPPQYSPEVFRKVMEQVENFEEHSSVSGM